MILVDCHSHINHHMFRENFDEMLQRAKDAGVKRIVAPGVNSQTNREVLDISKKYPEIVKCTLGLYPIDALNLDIPELADVGLTKDKFLDVDKELEFIKSQKDNIVGIGEVGMDFKYLRDHEPQQRENFQKVLDLAEDINKPIVVHSRRAELEVVDMIESSNVKKVVLHTFEGNKKLIKRAQDNGWYFSVPAVIARLKHFEMLSEMVNINQLLTETDSPWLSPTRGSYNEPANVLWSVKKIAEVKKLEQVEVANNIWLNYQEVFE